MKITDSICNKLNYLFKDRSPDRIAIAVSGGSDSMALAIIAASWAKSNSIDVLAVTVDHNLRASSSNEALQVQDWLSKYDIKHHIVTWQHNNPESNIQSLARQARYKMISNLCHQNNINYLLVAHNAEDKVETFFDRLSRGSGLDGLASMDETIHMNSINMTIVRPLLSIGKQQLRDFLIQKKQQWIEDPSNHNSRFKRVKIRKLIENLEDADIILSRITQTTDHLLRTKSYINQQVDKTFNEHCQVEELTDSNVKCHIDYLQFLSWHEEIALRILVKALNIVSQDVYKPRFKKLNLLYNKVIDSNNFKTANLSNCLILRKNEQYLEISSIKKDL